MRIAGYKKHSSVDGPGIRFVLFAQGCIHHCDGCQNPDTHDENAGAFISNEEIIKIIRNTPYIDGVTFSGGDPFLQPGALLTVTSVLKEKRPDLDIWVYTGWTLEELRKSFECIENLEEILKYIDVLVDGRFVKNLQSDDCIYRGSSNQRLIDVQATLKNKEVTLWQM